MDTKYVNKKEKKMRFLVKLIRISVFLIILLFLMCEAGDTLKKYGDTIKTMKIFYWTLPFIFIAFILLIIILAKVPGLAARRLTILDILSIAMFIILIALMQKEVLEVSKIENAFQGNNAYAPFYSNGGIGGGKVYDDMEGLLNAEIESRKKTGNHSEVEEILSIHVGEKILVYFKVDEEYIEELSFYVQDDHSYYYIGSMYVLYNSVVCRDDCTTEETIKKDIAYTMWRGGIRIMEGAPAWGVSADENIFSMMINSENVDDVIQVNEIDGKKYYFWIVKNTGEIETIEDVLEAKIHMGVH